GSNAAFIVGVASSVPVTYQWLLNTTNIPNATNSIFFLPAAQTSDAGTYSVAVSNMAGAVISSNAQLTVVVPPVLTNQPASLAVNAGTGAAFSAGASGSAPLVYQWQFNGTNLTNATNSSYSLLAVQASDAGTYTVSVTNLAGSATSSNAILTVIVPPVITNQPASQTVNAGSDVTLTVGVSGSQPLSYQWQKWDATFPGQPPVPSLCPGPNRSILANTPSL